MDNNLYSALLKSMQKERSSAGRGTGESVRKKLNVPHSDKSEVMRFSV